MVSTTQMVITTRNENRNAQWTTKTDDAKILLLLAGKTLPKYQLTIITNNLKCKGNKYKRSISISNDSLSIAYCYIFICIFINKINETFIIYNILWLKLLFLFIYKNEQLLSPITFHLLLISAIFYTVEYFSIVIKTIHKNEFLTCKSKTLNKYFSIIL